jgi:hypothetical protein
MKHFDIELETKAPEFGEGITKTATYSNGKCESLSDFLIGLSKTFNDKNEDLVVSLKITQIKQPTS